MINQNRISISGRAIPYHPDNEIIPLAEISIDDSRLEVTLLSNPEGPVRCSCEIWEHTIYELEQLSATLRLAAAGPFPPTFKAPTPESRIGLVANLSLAVVLEIGYSLEVPGAARARFFCSSRTWGSARRHGVSIGMALSGRFGEVVVEPQQAVELADWIDAQIRTLWPNDGL